MTRLAWPVPPWGVACATVFFAAWILAASDAGQRVDQALLDEMARLPGTSATWAEASWPGDTAVGLAVVALVAGACVAMRAWASAIAAGVCVLVFPLVYVVKLAVARERPETDLADFFSLPSGHAATSVVAFGAVALVLVPALLRRGGPRWVRPLARGLWLGLAFATGVARVAAGVHWPTDVLAGWAFGGLVLGVAVAVRDVARPVVGTVPPAPPTAPSEPAPPEPPRPLV